MNYATIKYCDIANGEGVRTSLFVSGCRRHCPNCFNAVAWDFDYGAPFTKEVRNKILESLAPGYINGLSLLGGEPLEVAVLAAADAEVLFLNSVQALSCARPGAAEFTRNLLTILAGRNLTLTRKIGHMARRTTRDKLLSYLSAQAMQAGGPEFDIPLDRQQLADYLAVDRSAMSTALGKLRDEGVLTFQKNHFHLLQQMEQTD